MAKEATRNAYGKALAELVKERDDVLVLEMRILQNRQRQLMPKRQDRNIISIWELPKEI